MDLAMPTQLQRDIELLKKEIDLVKRTLAKVEAGTGTMRQQVLDGLRGRLHSHESELAELEQNLRKDPKS
jgi:hypothetical protein